jgi:hypothetical protein
MTLCRGFSAEQDVETASASLLTFELESADAIARRAVRALVGALALSICRRVLVPCMIRGVGVRGESTEV